MDQNEPEEMLEITTEPIIPGKSAKRAPKDLKDATGAFIKTMFQRSTATSPSVGLLRGLNDIRRDLGVERGSMLHHEQFGPALMDYSEKATEIFTRGGGPYYSGISPTGHSFIQKDQYGFLERPHFSDYMAKNAVIKGKKLLIKPAIPPV